MRNDLGFSKLARFDFKQVFTFLLFRTPPKSELQNPAIKIQQILQNSKKYSKCQPSSKKSFL